uniref:Uncharacterized protein n=1 Tax=Parascaris equorum TaxID=6256 RepID=A0A914RJJ1_PAREQ
MGNWTSQHTKLIRSRTTLSDNSRKTRRDPEEMRKSKSFNEIDHRSSARNGHTRAITRSSSSARSPIVGSFRKDPSHPISNQGREIIVNCFENPHNDLATRICMRINDLTAIERVSRKYGEGHVELKPFGFKPDFWVSLADAITVECVILDMANHQVRNFLRNFLSLLAIMTRFYCYDAA